MPRSAQSRNWLFTLNNPEGQLDEDSWGYLKTSENASFMVYQVEQGEEGVFIISREVFCQRSGHRESGTAGLAQYTRSGSGVSAHPAPLRSAGRASPREWA